MQVVSERLVQGALIGQGAMAQVFKGELRGARGTVRPVAIKRLRAELCTHPEILDIFTSEARIGLTLNHAHIVNTIEFAEDDTGYFMVSEWLARGTLRCAVNTSGHLSIGVAAAVGASIGQALCTLHKQRDAQDRPLLHCDLSPDNIFISETGVPKLGDFGLMAYRSAQQGTVSGPCGTPGFAAPEQCDAQCKVAELDERCDIYGLAKLLEFLCPKLVHSNAVVQSACIETLENRLSSMKALVSALEEEGCKREEMMTALVGVSEVSTAHISLDDAMQGLVAVAPVVASPARAPENKMMHIRFLGPALILGTAMAALATWYLYPNLFNRDISYIEESSTTTAQKPMEVSQQNAPLPTELRQPAASDATPSVKQLPPQNPTPRPLYGVVSLNAQPWAKVYTQGTFLGDTPLARIRLRPGKHTLTLKHPGKLLHEAEFVIEVDKTLNEQVFVFDLRHGSFNKRVRP